MTEEQKTTKKEWIALIVPMVLMIVFLVFAYNWMWENTNEQLELFSSRDITECDKVYEASENWKPINGTLQEKYDLCADWYKPGGMNEAAIRSFSIHKTFLMVAPFAIAVGVLITTWQLFRPIAEPERDEQNE